MSVRSLQWVYIWCTRDNGPRPETFGTAIIIFKMFWCFISLCIDTLVPRAHLVIFLCERLLSVKPLGQYLSRYVCRYQNLSLGCLLGMFSEYVWKNLTGFRSHFLLFVSPLVLLLHILDLYMTVFASFSTFLWHGVETSISCSAPVSRNESCLSYDMFAICWFHYMLTLNCFLFYGLP